MRKGRLLSWEAASAAQNMAVDEAIFLSYLQGRSPLTLRFYGWSPPAVSIGYAQDLKKEIDLEACAGRNIQWVRRPTGGRSVLHDDEITYALVAGERDGFTGTLIENYLRIATGFQEGFRILGVEVNLAEGRKATLDSYAAVCFASPSWYEIEAGGRKLIGSAQVRKEKGFLQHGSILLSFDAGLLLHLLGQNVNNRLIEGLRKRMTCLEEIMGGRPEKEMVISALVTGLSRVLDVRWEPGDLTPEEIRLAEDLKLNKYLTPEWNEDRRVRTGVS